ncbi:MAG: Cupin 2 conserved barrel domain protein [Edaphobacter sp.]|jgi:mannose-6-phosphate isomerase-like protein (cupin superfamily)|nr:Cupin 2 conserved barrel domain protein [Edaphobacter sp.]
MSNDVPNLKAFKRAPSVDISTWYKGILTTQLAGVEDTGGAFDIVLSNMRKGTEPPPHVHTHENEFYYVLAGNVDVYVDGDVLSVEAGECVFLPKRTPHAFLIQSPEIRMLVLITPGGLMNAINEMAAPAEKLAIPSDDAPTYSTVNLQETMRVFEKYGVRFLTPEEIGREMPAFPMSLETR